MKKYWKMILISLVVIISISSYYIKTTIASKNEVSFKMETISGNKEEIENHMLEGSYQSDHRSHLLSMYISKDGLTNRANQSFIEYGMDSYEPPALQKYIKEHRNFMRSKELRPSQFFEDDTRLIYTAVQSDGWKVKEGKSLTFQIDILDKKSNNSSSLEINTPSQSSYDWINVNDINVENGKIKILATNYLSTGGEELHIYTIDEKQKKLELDAKISKWDPEKRARSSIRIFNDFKTYQNEKYYLYAEDQMYLYNNSTNEVEEWEIPAELKMKTDNMVLHGADIFIPVSSTDGLELHRYNIDEKQWEEPVYFKYSSNNRDIALFQTIEGKIYVVNGVSDEQLLFIGDLSTGETLYEGEIILEHSENPDIDYSFYIEQLYKMD